MFRRTRDCLFKIVLPLLFAWILYMILLRGDLTLRRTARLASWGPTFSLFQRHPQSTISLKSTPSVSSFRMSSTETTATPGSAQPVVGTPLPKLSASEFRQYNRLADGMQQYHNHFRATWKTLYNACEANKRPSGMSIRQFLALGDQFCSSLTMHHGIEERYIFPVLAERMPKFKDQEHLKKQHEGIHAGLDVFEKYLKDCRSGEKELRLRDEMKGIMDTFGEVLWKHLDDEVEELKAENMRKFWTVKEMQAIPF